MGPDEHISAIAAHAEQLGVAAPSGVLDTAVAPCPGWTVRDVLGHLGGVHRWAASYVEGARTETPGREDGLAQPPGDDELLEWFREGHTHLVKVLEAADDTIECWTFLPAPFPRAFWARRQAHETTVHHADVAGAAGEPVSVDTALAVDGIDELLLGFFSRRRGRLLADPGVTLGVRVTDAGESDAWTVRVGPQGREVDRGSGHGDLVVSGRASDVYLFLWNRTGTDNVELTGDERVLDIWRERASAGARAGASRHRGGGELAAADAGGHTDAVVRRPTDRQPWHRTDGVPDPTHPVSMPDGVLRH